MNRLDLSPEINLIDWTVPGDGDSAGRPSTAIGCEEFIGDSLEPPVVDDLLGDVLGAIEERPSCPEGDPFSAATVSVAQPATTSTNVAASAVMRHDSFDVNGLGALRGMSHPPPMTERGSLRLPEWTVTGCRRVASTDSTGTHPEYGATDDDPITSGVSPK